VKAAHGRGIRILLDMVTSLTTEGSYIMKEPPQWRMPGDDGKPQHFYPFPAWGWGLDCANPELIRYFSELAAWHMREYDIDGWRIDSPMNNDDPQKVSGDHSRLNLYFFRCRSRVVTHDVRYNRCRRLGIMLGRGRPENAKRSYCSFDGKIVVAARVELHIQDEMGVAAVGIAVSHGTPDGSRRDVQPRRRAYPV
jgi:hypothetical protein